jgi:hypothetical protein
MARGHDGHCSESDGDYYAGFCDAGTDCTDCTAYHERCEDTCPERYGGLYANDGTCSEPDGDMPGLGCATGTDCTDCTHYRSELACEGIDCGHYHCQLGECTEQCAGGWMGEVRDLSIPLTPAGARR